MTITVRSVEGKREKQINKNKNTATETTTTKTFKSVTVRFAWSLW